MKTPIGRVLHRSLTPYFNRLQQVRRSNLILWPFDETSGTSARAISGIAGDFTATYSGVTLAQPGGPDGRLVPSFDGINDYVNLLPVGSDLATTFNGAEGTVIVPVKVSGAGVWEDGSIDLAIRIAVDDNNTVELFKYNTNNTLQAYYKAGGVAETITLSSSAAFTDVFYLGVTWSKSANLVTGYLNGVSAGTSGTLGTWAGTLASDICNVGAYDNAPSVILPWSGFIPPVALYTVALSAGEVSYICEG